MTLDRKLLTRKKQHIKTTDKAQIIPQTLINKYATVFFKKLPKSLNSGTIAK
jgi:hypothetical protein